jgi:hypothetical protein
MSTSVVWGFPNPEAVIVEKAIPKYVALISQSVTNPPIAVVLENTLGSDVVWTYNSVGEYLGTLTINLDLNKTAVTITNSNLASNGLAAANVYSTNEVAIYTTDFTGGSVDGQLGLNVFEIRIYP